jgi:hypothetical protein
MDFIMHAWANSNKKVLRTASPLKDWQSYFFPLCLLILSGFFSTETYASDFSAQIKDASVYSQDGWYLLDADIDHILSPVAKDAIQSSIPLNWCLKIQVKQERYFHDKTLVNINYRYRIRYHALLNTYSVSNISTNTVKKYASLSEALDALSRIRELKVLKVSALKKDKRYKVAIKLKLNKEQLPAPLRPVAYLSADWDLSSDWYLWQLEQ